MATTIETLFGIDPSVLKLKQDQMGDAADANFGALMPKGYGAIGSAFSKLGRNTIGQGGMFGSNDPALAKASKIESILVEANKTSGTPLDKYKTILALMEQDPSLGREAMALSEKIASDEAALSKLQWDRSKDTIDMADKLNTSQANIEDKINRQSDRIFKQIKGLVEVNPDYWESEALSVLPTGIMDNDFNGDTTGRVLKEVTMQLIDARKTDANGNPTGLMFNGLQQALDTAKKIVKDSKPKAGFWWFTDDKVDMETINKLVINEVSRKNGRPENLAIGGNKEVEQETPVGPSGTTFVEMTPDGRAVFKYPDGREVVAKGSK
jgi:hypothetical protein